MDGDVKKVGRGCEWSPFLTIEIDFALYVRIYVWGRKVLTFCDWFPCWTGFWNWPTWVWFIGILNPLNFFLGETVWGWIYSIIYSLHLCCVCTLMCIWKGVSWIWGNKALIMRTPPQGWWKRIKGVISFCFHTLTQTQYIASYSSWSENKAKTFLSITCHFEPSLHFILCINIDSQL